jgi:hypothetical protein
MWPHSCRSIPAEWHILWAWVALWLPTRLPLMLYSSRYCACSFTCPGIDSPFPDTGVFHDLARELASICLDTVGFIPHQWKGNWLFVTFGDDV